MKLKKILLLSLLLAGFFTSNGYAQEAADLSMNQSNYLEQSVSERSLDKDKWQKITRKMDYSSNPSERKKKEKSFSQFIEDYRNRKGGGSPDESFFQIDTPSLSVPMFGGVIRYLLMGIVIMGLAFVIFKIIYELNISKNPSLKPVLSNVDLEKLEENIHETDLQRLLKEVLEKGNYKLAIRIHYLMIIRRLSELEWIDWRKNKTNLEYLTEVNERPIFKAFEQLTFAFERVWYGELEIGEREYQILAPKFEKLMN